MKKIGIFLSVMMFSVTGLIASEKTFIAIAEEYPPFTDSRLESKGWTWAVAKTALEFQGYKAYIRANAVKCSSSNLTNSSLRVIL